MKRGRHSSMTSRHTPSASCSEVTPPAQVHVHEMNAAGEQFLTQLRENKAHEMIPLRLHVAKGVG